MNIQCPSCAGVYEIGSPQFPAKVKCEGCGTKSLVQESGEIQILELGQPAASTPSPRIAPAPRTVVVKRGPKRGNSWAGATAALVVFGSGIFVLKPWLEGRKTASSSPPETAATPEPSPAETTVAAPKEAAPSAPAPAEVMTTAKAEEVLPTPSAAIPEPTPTPEETAKSAPATLEEVSPEIARAFQTSEGRITAAPEKAESEARLFLRGLFARSNGGSRAADLAKDHPDLLLGLLGDLWARIEESPAASLPDATRISIRKATGHSATEVTATYQKLLTPPKPGSTATPEMLAEISRTSDIAKLLQHFAQADDSGTTDNALVLGRMVHAFQTGKVPLADLPVAAEAVDPGSLPDVRKSVDLADFKDVRELVRWAHGMSPTAATKVNVPVGPEAERMLARVKAYMALPAEVLLPHPGAADFPGAVSPKAARPEKQVSIDLNLPRWQATGLYASPGKPVTVAVPAGLRKLGLKLRIGANTDNILKTGGEEDSSLSRFPIISNEFALEDARVTVGNPFGGAIYIDVPFGKNGGEFQVPAHGWTIRPFDKVPAPDPKTLSIAGAVEMPWWRPGMTPSAWRDELTKPAPWAEMDFGMFRICVPKEDAAEVKNPTELTTHWQQVMDAQWKFAGYPGHRYIPMRASFDRQISAGFMHSGYPIMAHVPEAKEMLDFKKLSTEGSWGMYHEIGHNHQPICITPSGFVESTVNLFTLATLKATIPKRDPLVGHGALSDPKALLKQRQEGKDDAWINLSLFLPLMKEFGYESLSLTLATYWDDARKDNGAINFSNEERQDQWTRRYGETVKRDVSEYFESVRYHVSPATKKRLSKFEAWKP